jgi:hypothetical protein
MLTATELTDMRATADAALPDTCTIQTKAIVSDGQGGSTESYSTSASDVACRVKAAVLTRGLAEIMAQSGVKLHQVYEVTFTNSRTLNKTDRIMWSGKTLEVVTTFDNSWQVHKKVACTEVV